MATLAPGLLLGGIVIASLGGVTEYVREKRLPSPKGVMRDFLMGAVMVAFLYQILPESMNNLVSSFSGISLPALGGLAGLTGWKGKGGGEGGSAGFDPDLQIGMPRF